MTNAIDRFETAGNRQNQAQAVGEAPTVARNNWIAVASAERARRGCATPA